MLFDRFSHGAIRLKNRLVRSAVCEGMALPDGSPSATLVDYSARLAGSHVGLIIAGMSSPVPDGCIMRHQCRLDRDDLIPAYRKLTGAVHASGGRIMLQLGHGGSRCIGNRKGRLPEDWSESELDGIAEAFAAAAVRARESGFDGVQIHGAHGYLLSEFLSPCRNARTDAYGGSPDNRARLFLKVLTRVRRAVKDEYPVLGKLNCEDFVPGGLTQEDSLHVMQTAASRGLTAVEISGGVPEAGPQFSPVRSGRAEAPYYAEFAAKIRSKLPIPVILVGGIRTLARAEELLSGRVCDLIALGRPLIAEPDLGLKWLREEESESVCSGCNTCFRPILTGRGVRCMKK